MCDISWHQSLLYGSCAIFPLCEVLTVSRLPCAVQVCTEEGKTAEGVQGQKRLILEHAAAIYDELRSTEAKTVVLEAGYAIEQEGEVVVCKVKKLM